MILLILAVIAISLLPWIVWVAKERPKSHCSSREVYIDDSTLRKVDTFECVLNWGTRLFPFRHLTTLDVSVSSYVLIRYTPPGGMETDLTKEYYEDNPVKNRSVKPIKLKKKHFFKENSINMVKVIVQTPFERSKYSANVKHTFEKNTLTIWNENAEAIRDYRFVVNRPIRLSDLEVTKGSVDSVEMEIAYPRIKSVASARVGQVDEDVTISLLLDLPPKGSDKHGHVVITTGS